MIRIRSYPVMGVWWGEVKVKRELRDQDVQPPRRDHREASGEARGQLWPGGCLARCPVAVPGTLWVSRTHSPREELDTDGTGSNLLGPTVPVHHCINVKSIMAGCFFASTFQISQTPLWASSNLELIRRRILGKAIPALPS